MCILLWGSFKKEGKISGFISKELPHLIGDGFSTIKQLLVSKKETTIKDELCQLDLKGNDKILKKGEIYYLSVIGNRHHGARFYDLSAFIDNELLALFDKISHTNKFYYGRYDIKCSSIKNLKEQKNFAILEFNGSGAIPNYVFTKRFTLLQASKEISNHWKILYKISRYNHQTGLPYWRFLKGYRFLNKAMKHYNILREYDKILPH
ncbi:MAG: hypothetical protein ABIY62_02925 [Ginsengibacter sp.]